MQNNDPMHVIRHDHECPQFRFRKMIRDRAPTFVCDLTLLRILHPTIDDLTKQTYTSLRNEGDEISTRCGLIISFQADGTAMMLILFEFHAFTLSNSRP